MRKQITLWLVLLPLILAACGGAETPPPTEMAEASPTPVMEATTETEPTATTAETEPTETTTEQETTVSEQTADLSPANPDAECTPVEIPENENIADITEDDWARGPADAPITLIEYGDYQ